MDTFPSSPAAAVRADLATLRVSLDRAGIPPKSLDRSVVVAIERPYVGRRLAPPQGRRGASTSSRCYGALSDVQLGRRTQTFPLWAGFGASDRPAERPAIGGR